MTSCSVNLCNYNEKFWMDDLRELYQNNNYLKFFPRYEMTRVEQLNAITRFCLYFILLIILFDKNEDWLYLPITIIVLVVILYNINRVDIDSKAKEREKTLDIRRDKRIEEEQLEKFDMKYDGEKKVETLIDDKFFDRSDNSLEAGYYDSDGILWSGPKTSPQICQQSNDLTLDEMINQQKNTCRMPTKDNPMMNLNINDYNNGSPPVACNADDVEVKDDMYVTFNHDLFRDVDELWERENNSRQFYTTPNHGVPNNQVEFAKWLYQLPDTAICKVDPTGGACLQYVSLRDRRSPVPQ